MSPNTVIIGDPDGCRTTGRWLQALAESALEVQQTVRQVQTASEYAWFGPAGEAFRATLRQAERDAGQLNEDVGRTGDAIVGFADDLDTARASMREARNVAKIGKVSLTNTTIEQPQPPSSSLTDETLGEPLGPSIDDIIAQGRAEALYERQMEAYREAETIVRRARGEEEQAHDDLRCKVERQQSYLSGLLSGSTFLNLSVSAPVATYSQSIAWFRIAEANEGFADDSRRLLENRTLPQAVRSAELQNFITRQGRSNHARAAAERLSRSSLLTALRSRAIGRTALDVARANLADPVIRRAEARGVEVPRATRALLGSVSTLSVATGAWGVLNDVRDGESVPQALASNGAALVAGGVATNLILASAAGGPAVLGAVVVGIGAGYAADLVVDELFHEGDGHRR